MPHFYNATDSVVNDLVVKRNVDLLKYTNSGTFGKKDEVAVRVSNDGMTVELYESPPDVNDLSDGANVTVNFNSKKHVAKFNNMLFTHSIDENCTYRFCSNIDCIEFANIEGNVLHVLPKL